MTEIASTSRTHTGSLRRTAGRLGPASVQGASLACIVDMAFFSADMTKAHAEPAWSA
jgi:hypothetical protein